MSNATLELLNVLVIALVGAVQLGALIPFLLLFLRDREPPGTEDEPGVTVVIPCKGEIPLRHLGSFLDQDYGGPVEHLFVAPSETDPAYVSIRDFLRERGAGNARVLSSGAAPERCAQALMNCAYGGESASPASELLVFADADLRVERDWLRRLTAPLRDPEVGTTTAPMLVVPERLGFWPVLSMLWMGLVFPYHNLRPCVVGHSYALRRRDFEEWDVAAAWRRSITTDAALNALLTERGKRIRYVPYASPNNDGAENAAEFFRVSGKWAFYMRVFTPGIYALSVFVILGKLALYGQSLFSPYPARLFAMTAVPDLVYGFCVFSVLLRSYPGRYRGLPRGRILLLAALAAPSMWWVYLANMTRAFLSRKVPWGGYVYLVRGPFDVEVIER